MRAVLSDRAEFNTLHATIHSPSRCHMLCSSALFTGQSCLTASENTTVPTTFICWLEILYLNLTGVPLLKNLGFSQCLALFQMLSGITEVAINNAVLVL